MSSEKTVQTLGSFLSQIRQYFVLKKQATYWFGGLLAIAEEAPFQLSQDLKPDQYAELCMILNHAFVSIFTFHMPELPSSVYKLLSIYRQCLYSEYGQSNSGILNKVSYLNNLAIFSLKTKDYNTTIISLEQIINLYKQGALDSSQQFILISFSNFLLLVRKDINSNNQNQSIRSSVVLKSSQRNFNEFKQELQNNLKVLFIKQLNKLHKTISQIKNSKSKISGITIDDQLFHLLLGIYHQHEQALKLYEENLILLYKDIKEIQQKINNMLVKHNISHRQTYEDKVYKKIITKIEIKKFQLHFHFASNIDQIYKQKQFGSLTARNNGNKLNKIEKLIEESVTMIRQQQFKEKFFQTIQPNRSSIAPNQFINSRYKRLTSIKPIEQSFNIPSLRRINSKVLLADQSRREMSFQQQSGNMKKIDWTHQKEQSSQNKKEEKQELKIVKQLTKQKQEKPKEQIKQIQIEKPQVVTDKKKQNKLSKFLPKFQTLRRAPLRTTTIGRPSVLANYQPKKRQIKILKIQIQPFILDLAKEINFKHNGIQMGFTEQGLLLADYSRTHSRYLQWNFVVNIITKIKDLSLLSVCSMLPISNFYDVARLLQPYVSRADDGQLKISKLCKPLLELNYNLTKLFPLDGPYLKVVQMNNYDPNRVDGSIDCFFEEHQAIFRTVYFDDFLKKINQLLCSNQKLGKKGGIGESRGIRDNYHLPMKRHKNENAVNQLKQLISSQVIDQCLRGQGDYKIILFMKNRNNLLFKIRIKTNQQSQEILQLSVIAIQMQTLHFETQFNKSEHRSQLKRIITLPMPLLNKYIPFQMESNLKSYLNKYGKLIFQLFSSISLEDDNIQITENIEIYYNKTCMVQFGRYYAPVSVEIFGDGKRVIGIIFRQYQLSFASQKTALFLNPYADFLPDFGLQSEQLKRQVLQKMLYEGNLMSTYNWLKKQNLFQTVRSLSQYLIRIGLLV